ncbi:hypothetical protein ACROYT_G015404 [Oculina patagonica]
MPLFTLTALLAMAIRAMAEKEKFPIQETTTPDAPVGIHHLQSLRDNWSSDWVLGVPAYANIMPRIRFLDIWSNLHLSDNSKMTRPGDDKLLEVRQFLEEVKKNFKVNYHPYREQAVDEAMIKYKGTTSLKQYMPMKPINRGIKMWCRADSSNGHLCDFDIHTGKSQ